MGRNQSKALHQQIHQQVEKEVSSTPSNAIEIDQLSQTRVPQEQLRSSTFILEEIDEHSREGIRPLIIEKMGKQYVPVSKLQEAFSK
ncbi:hypothetical protein RDI58_000667 [Solanum bulbocastanum]|uniref:Uncharacterized protein n=1 Tax=Solanum bulbocastanum TaxID=147425 RepID=A0AAN8U6L2_SOLBU